MSSIPCYVVDAFAEEPFTGNPAGVCLLDEPRDADWMQSVACEMKHSETAFLRPLEDGHELRWFTPAFEVDLCGHATLASAHILWTQTEQAPDVLRFHTRSGVLEAAQVGDSIELDFPATPATVGEPPKGLLASLCVDPTFVGWNGFDILVEVGSEEILRSIRPEFGRLGEVDVRGVIVTARSDSADVDFVSRFFAPRAGVNEDPVTGSAHCTLAPFWSERLDKPEMRGFQASARGGFVRVRLDGDRVKLGGQAITILEGRLLS